MADDDPQTDDVQDEDEILDEQLQQVASDDPLIEEEKEAIDDSEFSEPAGFRDKKHSDPGWFDPATVEAEAIEAGAKKGIGDKDDEEDLARELGMHVEDEDGKADDVESLETLRDKEAEENDEDSYE